MIEGHNFLKLTLSEIFSFEEMFLTESKIVYFSNIKEEKMDYEKIVQDLDLQNENTYGSVTPSEGRKRIRLHHLSWEEKIQRKKLRNRIAAQTSRDKKKAKMNHLEESVKELKQQNELLLLQVEELRKTNETLVVANTELQQALAERPYTCSCLKKVKEHEEKENSGAERSSEIEEQICVEDEMLATVKGDTFLDDLERLASSLLEEVEQHEGRRDTESELKRISGTGQQKCTYSTKVVGKTPKKLESSRSEVTMNFGSQQNCFQPTESIIKKKIWFISSEHSYSIPEGSLSQMHLKGINFNVPTITVSESDKISAIEDELKKDIEPEMMNSGKDNLDLTTFPNYLSPVSEVSSDQGYESAGSSYESEISKMEDFDDFNKLWGNTFSELFPELI